MYELIHMQHTDVNYYTQIHKHYKLNAELDHMYITI